MAGSALAAVIAAMLAGRLGVYGTVLGAGVVSVVATTGGTVFQHVFRRTGEQVREATVQAARPRTRQVPAGDGRQDPDRTQLLGQVDATQPGAHAGARPGAQDTAYIGRYSEDYTDGTTHGTRLRGWKRTMLAAGAIFVLAMGTVTAVELVSGSSADGSDGTTVSRIFNPGSDTKKQDPGPSKPSQHRPQDDAGEEGQSGGTPSPDASPQGGGSGKQSPGPTPTPSSGGSSPSPQQPTPGPSGSQGGGKSDDGKSGGTTGGQGTGGQGTGGQGGASPPPAQGQNAAAGAAGTGTSPNPVS
ncbi:hypothetical protein AB0A70_33820 [Streptomyces morookaense]|uniref:hypothetical protein n=1 Tax=Streptomyces morookaense TaxID=1970 RepID=UPI0034055FC2